MRDGEVSGQRQDALVERVSELSRPPEPAPDEPPATQLRAFAHSLRATLIRHPGVLPLVATRPLHGAGALPFMEATLARLRAAGLTAAAAMDLLNVLGCFVIGHTLAEVVATGAGLDMASRFARAVEVLLDGFGGSQLTGDSVTR
ncbi:TetR/AcrR family transcriptional regulator C-terminal domain-containing protein [Crossiella sp. NPDC003009]